MFSKILVANRGEIACRIIRTARKMGIETVAVYSDADALSPHMRLADEAVRLGPAPAAESYLLADKIIEICISTGAEAVHPGYGFLSERASFAEALAAAGIVFIGPPPGAIAAMGDKIQSKKLAQKAGVTIVPGYIGEIADTEEAIRIADDIGYPVMMKASAGGGGKGMRLAFNEQDVRDGFEATKREGLAGFGDERVFIEKFIENPRHIEVQILGDQYGNIIHLGERECSIQRRHQKVIEEAPSPFVDTAMREEMGAQAIALAKAVGYYSAGTVELIVGADKRFYFLEMNTRLQVEHPVTEYITGLDLVEEMIKIAAGERLSITQEEVQLDGWAVESRIYAENPYRNFLPSTGRLIRYRPPAATAHLRIDDGVCEGGEVSTYYDPMIAKLITHGATRIDALDRQIDALDRFEIKGPGHNIDFLSALMQHARFRSGALNTGFIAEEYPDGFTGVPLSEDRVQDLAAIAAFAAFTDHQRALKISQQLGDPPAAMTAWQVKIEDATHLVEIGEGAVSLDGTEVRIEAVYIPGDTRVSARVEGRALSVKIDKCPLGYRLTARGRSVEASVLPDHIARHMTHMIEKIPPDLSNYLLCPMPGLLVKLYVAEGEKVEAGQPLAVIEAMKMENMLRAEKSSVIRQINAAIGDSLAVDEIILEFD